MTELVGVYTSPRTHGNTDILLDEFLKGAAEAGAKIHRIYTRQMNVRGCIGCGGCDETGECVLRDDMDDAYPVLIQAERTVVAAPIYFYGLPAQAKALVDRTQALWNRNRLNPELRRPEGKGFFIGVGATRGRNLFSGTELCVKYFQEAIGLPLAMESLNFRQIEAKGAIKQHPTALLDAYRAGRAFGEK